MPARVRHLLGIMVVGGMLVCAAAGPAFAAEKPNFVFFLVDDLGYMDIGANNPHTFYETPNVDRLAREGMRFTQGYAANPVCSPTRFSILTGRYPTRVGATNYFPGVREGRFRPAPLNNFMPLDEVTIAEALKTAGYRTAYLGKWHLGPTEEFWPEHQGFDINIGGNAAGAPQGGYFSPWKNPRLSNGPPGEYMTFRLANESVKILSEFAGQPFLLYFAFYSVHTPLQAPPELIKKYEQKAQTLSTGPEFADEEQAWPVEEPRKVRIVQNHATYAAMVECMDRAVGQVLGELDRLGLADNTVVVFFSDNGGLSTAEGSPTSNLPLRGGKGWVYEGGIREAMIVKWPGHTPPASVCDTPVISVDFLPTLLDIAGIPVPSGHDIDGVSLVPLLTGSQLPVRDLFWHYPHYSNQGGFPGGAIRRGDLKLVERYEDGRVHLYNLRDDVGERRDLAEQMPEQVAALRASLHAWYRKVDARFLEPLPGGPQPWQPE